MTSIKLGINLNCFTNRFPEPEEWTTIVQKLGLKYVQFNADIIDPLLPLEMQERLIRKTVKLCQEKGITIHSSFGGHNHHQNYLGHADDEVAKWYEELYKRLIHQTMLLGGEGVGTCFAILSVKDSSCPARKDYILKRAAESYIQLSRFAKEEGLKYLLFETTSVPRETCATFEETDYVLNLVRNAEIPMKLCLDVGHRNKKNLTAPEADSYKWIKKYGKIAPVIHIQQTNSNASCHWPFTPTFNNQGEIKPKKIVAAIKESKAKDCLLALEINHKAYYPEEDEVINNLKESVNYWRRWIDE